MSSAGLWNREDVSTVEFDSADLGRLAAERLIERLTNPQWQPGRIFVQNKLVARESTRQAE